MGDFRLQSDVSKGLGKALGILHNTGNGVLHDDVPEGVAALVIAESEGESEIFGYLCGVVNRLAEEMITMSRIGNQLFELLPAGVRAGVDRRNAASPRPLGK
jgi:hypothetical protein